MRLAFLHNFFAEIKERKEKESLITRGILTPVTSFEEYSALVKEVKREAKAPLFTNCFMMPDEIKRLISIGAFYRLKMDNGLAFVDDEKTYYYAFFYLDTKEAFHVPQLDRNILAENVYRRDKMMPNQIAFEEKLLGSEFFDNGVYYQVSTIPQMPVEKYRKRLNAIDKLLQSEGKYISAPTDKQLRAFEKVYKESIDVYVQKKYSKKERKRQRDQGFLSCLTDDSGEIYAISISALVHGGAIASNKKYDANGYAAAMAVKALEGWYRTIPEDEAARKEYMRCRAFGWIKSTNTASLRLHKSLGYHLTDKEMHQFVKPGYATY